MGGEFHVAIPGEQRTKRATDGKAVEFAIADGNRLHRNGTATRQASLRHTQQSAIKWQDAIAVIAGPFREKDQIVAVGKALRDFVALVACALRPAIDKDGALQARQGAEQ